MRAETEAEILRQAVEHAKTVHHLSQISEQGIETIRGVIRDEQQLQKDAADAPIDMPITPPKVWAILKEKGVAL